MSGSDPRFLRTRQRLHDAMFRLAERQDITTVTVAEIAREAGIERTTFYLHYADRQAFLDAMGESLLQEFAAIGRMFEDLKVLPSGGSLPKGPPSTFWVTAQHPALYRQLLNGTASFTFTSRLEQLFEAQFQSIWQQLGRVKDPGSPPLTFRARYAAAASIGLLRLWLDEGDNQDAEQFATWMWDLLNPLWLFQSHPAELDSAMTARSV